MLRFLCLFAAIGSLAAGSTTPSSFQKSVRPFVAKHCAFCHNAQLKTGGLNLEVYRDANAALKDRRVWEKVVYYDDQFGNRLFSKTRAGMFLTISIVFAWFVFIPAVAFLYDLGLYLATVKTDEIVYLTNSQEILPEENIHSVQGCHALPCTDKNSIYFRIRATYFNEAWSLAHGRGLFFPDYVAASVPLSISRCTITSYGVRVKLIMRGMDIYPDLLRTECAPLQGDLPDGVAP